MISAPDDQVYVPDYARVLFISSGDHRESVAILEQAINRWPHQSTLYHGLIEVLLAAERPQKATSTAQDAVDLEPDNVENLLWLARSWLALDNQTEAERVAEEILRLDPDNEEALAIMEEQ